MDLLWQIPATLLLVAINGFFVAVEFAAVCARQSRLEAESQNRLLARLALKIKREQDLYLSSCQLGVTIASLALGAVTEPVVTQILFKPLQMLHLPDHQMHMVGFVMAMAITTLLHIVLGEQAPKNWAIAHSDTILESCSLPLVVFTAIFYPAIWMLNRITQWVLSLTGVNVDSMSHDLPHSEDELRALLAQAARQGTIGQGREELLQSALDFGDLKVRQIMTPRNQVNFLTLNQPIGAVLATVQKTEYTRLPLCDGDLDHVIGLVHMKDLFTHLKLIPGRLRFTDQKIGDELVAIADGLPGSAIHVIGSGDIDLTKIKRDVLFVPERLAVPKLLQQFQTQQTHMAVVVDEYGATLGIVTLEDVIEEIVGEIHDEFDQAPPLGFVVDGENFRTSGTFAMHELLEKLHLDPAEVEGVDDVDTLGGYITQKLSRWPRVGDSVDLGKYQVTVATMPQKRRVGQVRISLMKAVDSVDAAINEKV